MTNYEAWRQELIAFYWAESPWMAGKREHLRQGGEFTEGDKRIIEAIVMGRASALMAA